MILPVYVGEEDQVLVWADKMKFPRTVEFPGIVSSEMNTPAMRGIMSFT